MSRPVNNGFSAADVRECTVFIYGLREVGTTAIRYVGRSQDPEGRLAYHCSRQTSLRLFHWTGALRREGRRVEVVRLVTVPPGFDAAQAELSTIRALEAAGEPLLNYHGLVAPPPKLGGKRDRELYAECAALGKYAAQRWSQRGGDRRPKASAA